MQKHIRFVSVVGLILGTALLVNVANATLLLRWDVEEVAQAADLVVVADITDNFTSWNGPHTTIYTHTTIEIVEVIAGETPQNVLHVVQLGGTIGETHQLFSGAPRFTTGNRHVLFLEKRITGKGDRVQDHWLVTGLFQGNFRVQEIDGKIFARRPLEMRGVRLVDTQATPHHSLGSAEELVLELSELRKRVLSVKGVQE